MKIVQTFFSTGGLDPSSNGTFIVPILKKEGVQKLEDFRPISLCNVRYKIISKILVNRIRPLLSKCISPTQGAFMLGKCPVENIIIAKEVLHVMSQPHRKKKFCAVKVDVHKAYDSLLWDFLQVCLRRYGFFDLVTNRLMTCVSSVHFQVLINGQPT